MKKTKIENLLSSIEQKELDLQESLEQIKPSDLSASNKDELIERVEGMIEKMEDWKSRIKIKPPKTNNFCVPSDSSFRDNK